MFFYNFQKKVGAVLKNIYKLKSSVQKQIPKKNYKTGKRLHLILLTSLKTISTDIWKSRV